MLATCTALLRSCLLGLAALCVLPAASGVAQDCAEHSQSDTEVMPARGAERVARNIAIEVRYPEGTDLGALLQSLGDGDSALRLLDDAQSPVSGHLEQLDARTLRFVPDSPLLPSTDYVPLVAQPGLSRPAFSEYRFTTGQSIDNTPPKLGANANAIDVVSSPLPASCGAAPGSYGVTVDFAPGTDNADASAIEYSLLLTRATGVDQPVVVDQTRQTHAGVIELRFHLTKEQVPAPVCIAVRAVDGVGLLAENQPALCFHPVQGSYFEPYCAVGNIGEAGQLGRLGQDHRRARSDSAWAFLVAFGLLCLRRIRAGERRSAGQSGASRNQRGS